MLKKVNEDFMDSPLKENNITFQQKQYSPDKLEQFISDFQEEIASKNRLIEDLVK